MPGTNKLPPFLRGFRRPVGDILCVDIGGSAIKTSILPNTNRKELIGILSGSGAPEFHREPWEPKKTGADEVVGIVTRNVPAGSISTVLISLPGEEVTPDGRETRGWLTNHKFPVNFASTIETTLGLPTGSTSLCHDSRAWAQGVRSILGEYGRVPRSGLAVLVVGTGVAYSIVRPISVQIMHLHAQNHYDWAELRNFARFHEGDWIHKHFGTGYFGWRTKTYKSEADRIHDTRTRFQLVLDELQRVDKVSEFVFAGGWVQELERCHFVQNHSFLTKDTLGFDPGFVPMLGMFA